MGKPITARSVRMTADDKIKRLLARCKCGVFITVNQHRDYYKTATDKLGELECMECPPQYTPEVKARMIETDTIIELQFYPDTPIGSYSVYHYDLDTALDCALECLDLA
jgi:hypothetical protein